MTSSMHRFPAGWHLALAATLSLGCAPDSLVNVTPPSDVVDPSVVATATGATQFYNGAVSTFVLTFGGVQGGYTAYMNVQVNSGLISDELMSVIGVGSPGFDYDARLGFASSSFTGSAGFYAAWHRSRMQLRQAREALERYAPAISPALRGQVMSLEAHTILWFAELYCSGIPLSSVPLVGAPAPSPGLTTADMLTRAAALFDSAITLSGDSVRFVNLAKVGKGRALLGLGRFADAAAAVSGVPTDFVYALDYTSSVVTNYFGTNPRFWQTVDNEGGSGLIWSTDPRAAITTTPSLSGAMKYSAKYSRTSNGTLDPTQTITTNGIVLASGLEARLTEAEADLATNGTAWRTILNTLRSTCVGSAACAPVPGLAAATLPPLADPGTPDARLDLLMRERALWLFLTGHREGDMRRMARVYNRAINTVWPSGTYSNPGFPPLIAVSVSNGMAYGTDVAFAPTASEESSNPLYQGCDGSLP